MGWLIALAVLIVLAWLPLGATARYNSDGISLKIIAGPLRIGVLPKKPKEDKKGKPKKQKPKKAPPANKQAQPAAQKEKGGPITDFLSIVQNVQKCQKRLNLDCFYTGVENFKTMVYNNTML